MNAELKNAARAHVRYKDVNGKAIPGVTTILGVLAKPALIRWANKQGLAGIDTSVYVQQAATAGTIAHYMIECHVKDEVMDLAQYPPNLISIAENGYLKWLDWESGKNFKLLLSEGQLVSEAHGFGGTIDIYAVVEGQRTLVDIKTSDSGIWPEMRHQVAAYKVLLEENGYPVDRVVIVRVGKDDTTSFATEQIDHLEKHFELFLHAKAIFELQKELGR